MHINKVTATAFGALSDRTLELAPGLTVVSGRNESAKSTWHAATYAALCGRRRGPGASKQMRAFRDRHRPWAGGRWAVGAELTLADGRRMRLTHDLDGRVDCRATDLGLARDVSAEIMFQNSPDGSGWLGLDRDSFAATACVKQADLLGVLERADGLQDHLQKAAASAGADDPTAAQALVAIDEFLREHVGVDRVGIRRPLRAAKEQLEQSQRALNVARTEHTAYLSAIEEAERRRAEADAAQADVGEGMARHKRLLDLRTAAEGAVRAREEALRRARANATQGEAVRSQRADQARAHELHELLGGQEPRGVADNEHLATTVASAVDRWTSLPAPIALEGQSADELQRCLDELPAAPEGDLEPHHSVERAAGDLREAQAVADHHAAEGPRQPDPLPPEVERAIRVGPATLRDLASRVEAAPDLVAARAAQERAVEGLESAKSAHDAAKVAHAEAQSAAESAEGNRRRAQEQVSAAAVQAAAVGGAARPINVPLAVLAVVLGIIGAALLTTQTGLGVALLAAGAALAVAALVGSTPPGAATGETGSGSDALHLTRAGLAEAESLLAAARERERRATASLNGADRAVAVAQERQAAADGARRTAEVAWSDLELRCADVGISADPGQLRSLALRAESAEAAARRWQDALRLEARDRTDVDRAKAELLRALAERGIRGPGESDDPTALLIRYTGECRERADQARQAGARGALETALRERRAAEAAAGDAARARADALRGLIEAASAVGLRPSTDAAGQDEAAELVESLTTWQAQRHQDLERAESDQRAWAGLQAVLKGGTIEELDCLATAAEEELLSLGEAAQAAAVAAASADAEVAVLAAAVGVEELAGGGLRGAPVDLPVVEAAIQASSAAVDSLIERASALTSAADQAEGALAERARTLPSVPEAEEALAAAEAENARVLELSETLSTTRRYLAQAQDRVHRDIAPLLAATLTTWLPRVTEGRYVEAMIDPASLKVHVRPTSGDWIEATRLSLGTAEQVYLLLHVALAEHLGDHGEPCPLLLDDVTVQADGVRTVEILETLLALSQDRQVVLFAQEAEVLRWAQVRLAGDDRHSVVELDQLPVG
ncbi:MAG: AAA family ATPase [Candidatus Nanopelagicales bacterium]